MAQKSEGLSPQTLIIASIASAIAAIVVSRVWGQGTIIASALTPVIVALVSEGLRKPIQSDYVRRPVRAVGSSASRVSRTSRVAEGEEARPPSGRTPTVMAPPPPGVDEGLRQRDDGVEPGPVKVYSSGTNRRPREPRERGGDNRRVKIAVVTGLIGFLIAAAVLTLPELLFGGSVTGGSRDTTYFGGSTKSSSDTKNESDGSSDGQSDTPADEQDSGSDSGGGQDTAPPDSGSGQPAPDSEGPAPDTQTPAPAPSQPAPQTPSAPTPTP